MQFLKYSQDGKKTGAALEKLRVYSLFLNIISANAPVQIANQLFKPLAIQTVSVANQPSKAIVYDQNAVFSNLALAPAADLSQNSFSVQLEISSAEKQSPDAAYEVIFTLFNKRATATPSRYQFFFT